jgi:hypothetical protein
MDRAWKWRRRASATSRAGKRWILLLGIVGGLLVSSATSEGASPPGVNTKPSVLGTGQPYGGMRGGSIGDVDGDGRDDLAATFGSPPDTRVAIVSGAAETGKVVDLAHLPNGASVIRAASSGDLANAYVAPAGDVNGDGLGDLLVSAPLATVPGRGRVGAAFVVFGAKHLASVNLGSLGSRGFAMYGEQPTSPYDFGTVGAPAAAVGDLNGDGLADIALRSSLAQFVVVDGKRSTDPVDLAALGTRGFTITSPETTSLGGGGDVNGDGLDDLVLGASQADNGAGRVSVILGGREENSVSTASLGDRGWQVVGSRPDDDPTSHLYGSRIGESVAIVGDTNGDGFDDIAIGGALSNLGGGSAFLVLGRRSAGTISLARAGSGDYVVSAAPPLGGLGASVSGVGDVNGDGLADFAVGAPQTRTPAGAESGAAVVVMGARSTRSLDTADLSPRGYIALGSRAGANAGSSVSDGGLEATGVPALFMTAPLDAPKGRSQAGSIVSATTPTARILRLTASRAGDTVGLRIECPSFFVTGCSIVVAMGTETGRIRRTSAFVGAGRIRVVPVPLPSHARASLRRGRRATIRFTLIQKSGRRLFKLEEHRVVSPA